jgi:ABC-type uncharacterized transport system substrate-binding protein
VRRVEFPVQPRAELQGLEDRSGIGQHGLHCLDRVPLGTFAKRPGECREDRVLVALRESWSPRPPVRVAGLTRFPGPQISETRRLRHQLRECDRITVPSLLRAGGGPVRQKATASLPIVMVSATDPVASGFVASLARPGGNITGLTVQTPDVAGKRQQLLKEAIPNLARIAVLWDPGHANGRQQVSEAQAAARTLGMQLQLVEMRGPDKIDAAFAAISRDRAGAAFIIGSSSCLPIAPASRNSRQTHRLPSVCPIREYVEAGCRMVYGASISDQWRRAAYFVDRLRKGGKPADLPVEQPTKFYLAINLKTARALGITLPQSLLVRADEIVQ